LATVQVTAAVTPIQIGQISVNGSIVTINFTGDASDSASSFKLQSATTVNGTFNDDLTAVITETGPGAFQAVVSSTESSTFYRIRK
jgi:hypothetical protein